MKVQFIQLNKQVFKTSLGAAFSLLLLGILCYYILGQSILFVATYLVLSVLVIFLIFRASIQDFILKQLRKVYDSSLFENEPFLKKESKELDFELFLNKVSQFAEKRREEIDQLHDRDDFRKEYLGDVSHELKTPIFTAQGYLLTVLEESMDDPELEKKYLNRAKKSLDRLSSIVKDLEMLARLESGIKLEQTNFNVIGCIQDVLDMLEFTAQKRNITVGFDKPYTFPIMVKADREKIERVLINLLQNSINYGKIGGQTTISIKTHSEYRLMIEVKDNGVGIEQENLSRLFERFYRVDKSRSREHGGSGLGLAIVKHILEAHDQEIMVRSVLGEGSTFSFTLNKGD